jgi:hypothetical protein
MGAGATSPANVAKFISNVSAKIALSGAMRPTNQVPYVTDDRSAVAVAAT